MFPATNWDFHYGIPFTQELEDMVIKELSESYYEGLTILGGEPFELQNQPDVLALILRVKKELPEKNIWMYTGYTYHQDLVPGGCRYIPDVTDTILDHIDVLVDDRFEEEKKNLSLFTQPYVRILLYVQKMFVRRTSIMDISKDELKKIIGNT